MKKQITYLLAVAIAMASFTSCKKEFNVNDPGALVPKTVDQDPGLPSISVNGTQLHSEAFGNPTDPMVVFLHGGPGGDYRNGMKVKELVNNDYYVVFYDQRGSGLSKREPKDSYSIQVMLDDLTAVIAHYRSSPTQKIFLFGHSWGAMLATAYVNKYPNDIYGLILAEPGGFTWDEVKEYAKASKKIKLFNEATNNVLYPDQFLNGKPNEHAPLDYKLAISSAYSFAKNNDEGIEGPSPFWRYGAAMLKKLMQVGEKEGFNFRNNLSNYQTRILFLYSENNRAYGEAFARREALAFPHPQIVRINGTGHEMIWFKWESVYAHALPYLNSLR
jgi:proline iminopeptidase